MKYDVDHSTPYFQGIFQNVSDDDMTGGVKALQTLTTYHKKNHYQMYLNLLQLQLIQV